MDSASFMFLKHTKVLNIIYKIQSLEEIHNK